MNNTPSSTVSCLNRIRKILGTARKQALQTVNSAMISAYWHIGREIIEEEQRGKDRADYGTELILNLSKSLTLEFGKGFSVSNLRLIRQFYLTYPDRSPQIRYSVSSELLDQSNSSFLPELSWTHYRVLMRVNKPEARRFYEIECAKSRWSVRELERQIASLLYERLALSRDKKGLLDLAEKGFEVHRPEDLIKDPYVLEFTGLPEVPKLQESDLEQALINRLQQFLLELGNDLFFVARQKRITIDGDHFFIDLVFYHRILRCFLLIDLKIGKLTQQDLGQMLLYTGYYEVEEQLTDENPPIGLILCTDKNDTVVRYTLGKSAQQIFASRYQLHLPTEEELRREIQYERELIEQQYS